MSSRQYPAMLERKTYLGKGLGNICAFLLYALILAACDSDGAAEIDTAPVAPSNLTASVSGADVNLSWNTVSAANSYRVYRNGELLYSVGSNSFSDNDLADGTYLYEVSSVNDAGESADKASISVDIDNLSLDAPTDLTASVTNASVYLSWSVVSGAETYKIYRDGDVQASISTNSFSDYDLADGTYLYEVSSVNDVGESADKASISVDIDNLALDAPTDLTASVTNASVYLSWSLVSSAETYKVYRDGDVQASISTNSFSDYDLADGTYLYEVSSVNDDFGESEGRANVSVEVNTSPPASPTNLAASVSGANVSLSWSIASGASGYRVYRDGNILDSVSTNSFSESGLTYGTYLYEVASINDFGEGPNKPSLSVDVHEVAPEPPTDLRGSVSLANASLTWSVVNGASSYNIYRDGELLDTVGDNSFSESELAYGSYLYEVSAVNEFGESAGKDSVRIDVHEVAPDVPGYLTALVSGDSVSLSWGAANGASSYNIYRDGELLDTVSGNSFSESGLDSGIYLYGVASVNEFGESSDRADITVTVIVDPLVAYQWHLENNGQSAFASYPGTSGEDINHSGALALGATGKGVRINVIDTGLELQHPDLQANIVADGSYDYVDGDNDPTNNYEDDGDHGTSVAGLIAAVGDNGIGASGVAGDAELQAYNYLLADPQTLEGYILAHGLDDKLANTDIFNKSLGAVYTADAPINSSLLDTLSCLTTGGNFDMSSGSSCSAALRSGLGAIYVKAAGNSFATSDDDTCDELGLTCWNANMEPEQTYPYQIVVGALNANGRKSSYSTAGSAIWVSAPGGEYGWEQDYVDEQLAPYRLTYENFVISDNNWEPAMITTDQVGCGRGYSTSTVNFILIETGVTSFHENSSLNLNCEYTSIFNGTSSAAPVVSGVVALMLEAKPGLSWRDVKHILAQSARQVNSDIAELVVSATNCSDSECSFTARDAWITNAADFSYHNWYGFGAINAGAAVAMAQDYESSLGSWQKNSYSQSTSPSIPDATGDPASISLTASDDLTIEAVQLDLRITHPDISDLAVVLYSPSGTRSVLLTPYNQYSDKDFSSTLLSNAFYGENSIGDWLLEIHDLREGNSGSLASATISIYGH